MTNEEIIEGLQSGRYKIERLIAYKSSNAPDSNMALSVLDGLIKRKESHFDERILSDKSLGDEKIKVVDFYFVLRQEEK